MTEILDRIEAAIAGICPCGADLREGSAYCSGDCTPTHIADDTDTSGPGTYGSQSTAMRWRPDLVTEVDDITDRTLVREFRRGPHRAQIFTEAERDGLRCRLDDGHRFVELFVGNEQVETDGLDRTWERLDRELGNSRHVEADPWADVARDWYALSQAERERICAWLVANDINPNDVPLDSRIRIGNGRITLDLFQRADGGQVVVSGDEPALTQHTTTLREPWPAGLRYDHLTDVDAVAVLHLDNAASAFTPSGAITWDSADADPIADIRAFLNHRLALYGQVRPVFDDFTERVHAAFSSVQPTLERLGWNLRPLLGEAPPEVNEGHPMLAAIERRRNRNTGPEQRQRAPRQISPTRR
jgi:hypothetical protein